MLNSFFNYYYSTATISNLSQLPWEKLDVTQWLLQHPSVNPGDFLFLNKYHWLAVHTANPHFTLILEQLVILIDIWGKRLLLFMFERQRYSIYMFSRELLFEHTFKILKLSLFYFIILSLILSFYFIKFYQILSNFIIKMIKKCDKTFRKSMLKIC